MRHTTHDTCNTLLFLLYEFKHERKGVQAHENEGWNQNSAQLLSNQLWSKRFRSGPLTLENVEVGSLNLTVTVSGHWYSWIKAVCNE